MHVSSHTEVFKLKHSEMAHSVPACPAEKMPSFLCICAIFCWKNDTIVYQSSATAAFIAIALSGAATRCPQSFYWGWWLSWAYSGQMKSSPIVATTFNPSSLNIPNEGLQANSEEILEQACCYYQGNTHCSILKVINLKSCMSSLQI